MTPRQRRLHDLHRVATHSNLAIQETPMSAFVSRTMRSLIETERVLPRARTPGPA